LPHRKSRSECNKIPSEFCCEFHGEFSCEFHQRCAVMFRRMFRKDPAAYQAYHQFCNEPLVGLIAAQDREQR